MSKNQQPIVAFENLDYMHSSHARKLRVLAEFSEPEDRFTKQGIKDTVIFFGSARTKPMKTMKPLYRKAKRDKNMTASELKAIESQLEMSQYYEMAVELSRQISNWLKERTEGFAICSGGGPGMMEAANKGAKLAGFPSIGLNINLPFEQEPNPHITPQLNFEFHYFFVRKYWFIYLAKAIIVFPGGVGTLDEMMEVLTLVQTKKIEKRMPIILFGKKFWKKVINFDYLVETGMISKEDFSLFHFSDSVEDAFQYVTKRFSNMLNKRNLKNKSFLRSYRKGNS